MLYCPLSIGRYRTDLLDQRRTRRLDRDAREHGSRCVSHGPGDRGRVLGEGPDRQPRARPERPEFSRTSACRLLRSPQERLFRWAKLTSLNRTGIYALECRLSRRSTRMNHTGVAVDEVVVRCGVERCRGALLAGFYGVDAQQGGGGGPAHSGGQGGRGGRRRRDAGCHRRRRARRRTGQCSAAEAGAAQHAAGRATRAVRIAGQGRVAAGLRHPRSDFAGRDGAVPAVGQVRCTTIGRSTSSSRTRGASRRATARQFLTPYGVEFVELPEAAKRVYIFDIGGPHTFRTIYMDGRSHSADFTPTYYGHSIGWWDGDTLVVDTDRLQRALLARPPRPARTPPASHASSASRARTRRRIRYRDHGGSIPARIPRRGSAQFNLRWEDGTRALRVCASRPTTRPS